MRKAQKTQVRPEYIWAIMRQESNFNPLARSPTGAIGLMQLMPQVAKNLLGTNATEEELRAPELNIALGARHLKEYLDRFRGNFVLSTAAYNASPETVKNWLKSRSHKDPTLFIEDIPYEETRNYVKLVIRNFINYTRQTTQDQEIEFPQMIFANAGAAKNDHE
jgi:soluble lytic murein transglycosylase